MPEEEKSRTQQLIDYLKGTHKLPDPTMSFTDAEWTDAFDAIRAEKSGCGRGKPYSMPF